MLSVLSRFIMWARKKIGTVEYKKIAHATPEDWERLPEEARIERADQKGEIIKLRKKIDKFEKHEHKKAKKVKVAERIAKRHEHLRRKRIKEITPLRTAKRKKIKVMSKDNKFLGFFNDLALEGGEYPGISILVTLPRRKGRFKVFTAPSIDMMIHNSETVADQLNAGYLQLNRTWDGKYVPDIKYFQPIRNNPGNPHNNPNNPSKKKKRRKPKEDITLERRAEDFIGEQSERISALMGELENIKKLLAKETIDKETMGIARNIERLKSDSALAALYVTLENLNKWTPKLMQMVAKSQEDAIVQSSLHATVEPLIDNVATLRTLLMEILPMDQRTKALEDLDELMTRLKKHIPKEKVVEVVEAPTREEPVEEVPE